MGCAANDNTGESGVRALAQLQGRVAGLLRLPDGRVINCIFWNHLFKEYEEIEQFQIILVADRKIDICLKGKSLSEERIQGLRSVLARFLGNVPFDVALTDRLALGPQGKLDQVVRRP
jgi:hypothetical protein